jgi:predicted nucleic acid-binding Zn finger protein
LALRWQRAWQIDPASIEPLGLGRYVVPSSRDPTGYAVHIEFDVDGKLSAASCTCPDFAQRAPDLHGIRACKHILAACRKAQEVTA